MTLIGEILACCQRRMNQVSILVFLDDAHRPRFWAALGRYVTAFQSLFSWMTLIGVIIDEASALEPEMFQSLFSWMTLIGLRPARLGRDVETFQSLFSWMTLIGQARNERLWETDWVSILVFLDDAHRLRTSACSFRRM